MANNIVHTSAVTLNSKDKILFDCNILMYLFYTYGGYSSKLVNTYQSLFKNAVSKNCGMYIPSMEISEFINTYVRAEYKRYLRSNQLSMAKFDFKHDYRMTDDYCDTINEIKNIINRQILSLFYKLDDEFSQIDITNIYYAPKQFDFNDRYYFKLAEKHSLSIITNDADFCYPNENVRIITANNQLLANVKNINKKSTD
jgi:hypothetical protein